MARVVSDAEIVVLSREQPELFVEVFERHFDTICGYLVRRVGRDLGGDLAAEVFTTAFAARGRYEVRGESVEPWLFGIAANLLRRHYRREARYLAALARRANERDQAAPAEPSLDATVIAALRKLPVGDREVLLLFAWADLSYAQIAEALGCPIGTVRSRLNRARRSLRAALSDTASLTEPTLKEEQQWMS